MKYGVWSIMISGCFAAVVYPYPQHCAALIHIQLEMLVGVRVIAAVLLNLYKGLTSVEMCQWHTPLNRIALFTVLRWWGWKAPYSLSDIQHARCISETPRLWTIVCTWPGGGVHSHRTTAAHLQLTLHDAIRWFKPRLMHFFLLLCVPIDSPGKALHSEEISGVL